jgi:hypothetical protein
MEWRMPLARYFVYVGGVLLALLFIADACLPKSPVPVRTSAVLPVIRIHSDRKWPERVVFDTRLPAVNPAPIANAPASVPALATVADVPAKTQVREAFAQLQPSDAPQLQQSKLKKPVPAPQRKRKIARKRMGPPMILVARQSSYGWFGNTW